jgi:hypothetical protein
MPSKSDLSNNERLALMLLRKVFKLRFWVVFIGFVIMGILGYLEFKVPHSTVKDVVSVVTGCGVIISLFYLAVTYEYNLKRFDHESKTAQNLLTFQTATEWYKEPMVTYMRDAQLFFTANNEFILCSDAKSFYDKLEEDEKAKAAIISILNFYESIAIAVNQNVMNEHFCKVFFGSIFADYYNKYLFYIEYRRKIKANRRIWNAYTKLACKWLDS